MQLIITNADLFHLAVLSGAIIIVLILSEVLRRTWKLEDEFTRKFVHIATGIVILFSLPYFPRSGAVVAIAVLFVLVNMLAYMRGWLKAVHHSKRKSFGTVYYPLALLLLAFPLWNVYPDLVVASIMIMAIGDAAAGITGERLRKPHLFRISGDPKSAEGSLAMFLGSLAALAVTFALYPDSGLEVGRALQHYPTAALLALMAIALFVTVWEAASSRGLDNLTVPLMAGLALHLCFTGGEPAMLRFAAGTGLGLCIALAAYGLRMLTISGAAATFLLASIVFGIGGWQWTLPIFTFFLLSSLLSRWRRARKQRFDSMFEKGGTRDAGQVTANGAIVGALAIVWYVSSIDNLYLLSLVAVAVVTADTWGTELGVLARKRPRSIVTGKTVPAGTSGGVTFAGTLGGALGAAVVTAAAILFVDLESGSYLLIVFLGVAGSAIDSILGATLQAQYRCAVCHADTEKKQHCDSSTQHVHGYRWMTNDAVNLLSTLLAVLLGTELLMLL